MPCRVPKRRFSCGAPQHLTKNPKKGLPAGSPFFFFTNLYFPTEGGSCGHEEMDTPGPLYFKVPDDCVCGKGKPFPITKAQRFVTNS